LHVQKSDLLEGLAFYRQSDLSECFLGSSDWLNKARHRKNKKYLVFGHVIPFPLRQNLSFATNASFYIRWSEGSQHSILHVVVKWAMSSLIRSIGWALLGYTQGWI